MALEIQTSFDDITRDRREVSRQLGIEKCECPIPKGVGTLRVKRVRVLTEDILPIAQEEAAVEFINPEVVAVDTSIQTEQGSTVTQIAVAGEPIRPFVFVRNMAAGLMSAFKK